VFRGALRIEWMGYEVVLLDCSEEMPGIARQQAKGASEAGPVMRPEFAAIARYMRRIARRSCACSSKIVGP
jgi:hypothetical protein